MILAKVMTKDFDLPDNLVRKGFYLEVVKEISDSEKSKAGWFITPTEVTENFAYKFCEEGDFEYYSDEPPKMMYQFKTESGNWLNLLSDKEMQEYSEHGYAVRVLYQIEKK